MRPRPVPWEPWVIVLVTLGILALVMLAGAFALWLYLWSQFD